MPQQKIIAVLSLIGLASIAVGGSAIAGTGTAGRITVCYNAKTHVARYSGTGKCAPGVRAVVIGKGDDGDRGALGPHGPRGWQGAFGLDGANGTDGSNGSGGTNGNNGAAGATGIAGPSGPTGSIGSDGPTGATGSGGATGPAGPTGATGGSGVNTFHRVVSGPLLIDGTITASCPVGEVATGGGFTGTAVAITGSAPNSAGTGWSITVDSDGTAVTANAVCVVGTSS